MRKRDTSEEMHRYQVEWYRKLSDSEKFQITLQMMDDGRTLVASSIKNKFPDISEIDLQIEIFTRIYKKDFSKEEMENITSSMRTSLEKYFSEQKQ